MRLTGRVALVTGGGHGIGRAIAARFAAEGCALMLCGTKRERLDATAAEIAAGGGRVATCVTDVSDETAVALTIKRTTRELGRLDILVNNAGIAGPTSPVADLSRAEWDRTMAINLTGTMLCSKHAIPHLAAGGHGRVINITSVAGLIGYALRSPYAASKWAMIGLTRSLAIELGAQGVTVNAIAPGSVRGERIENVVRQRAAALGRPYEEVEREFYVSPNALQRMVDEDEIAATAAFLASDEARGITGETIGVTAGFRL